MRLAITSGSLAIVGVLATLIAGGIILLSTFLNVRRRHTPVIGLGGLPSQLFWFNRNDNERFVLHLEDGKTPTLYFQKRRADNQWYLVESYAAQ